MDDRRIQRSLTYSIVDGLCASLTIGWGEAFIVPLLVVLGFSGASLGLLVTVPILLGALSQFFSGLLLDFFRTRKRLVVTLVIVQACSLLGFAAATWRRADSFGLLLALLSIYWVSGTALNPAWSSWIGALTEAEARGKYFGRRGQLANLAMLCAYGLGGWTLHHFHGLDAVITGHVVLFVAAFAARLGSAVFLLLHYEPALGGNGANSPLAFLRSGWDLVRQKKHPPILFMMAMNMGVYFSAAYFTPYMLQTLRLSYFQYGLVICAALAAKIIFLPAWGYLVDLYGARKALVLSAALVAIVPILWVLAGDFWYLCTIQFFSGIVWGGFELASFNLMLYSTAPDERIGYYAWYNTLSGLGQIGTSAAAGWLLGADLLSYHGVYFTSGLLRLVAFAALAGMLKEVRAVKEIGYRDLLLQVLIAKPAGPSEHGLK